MARRLFPAWRTFVRAGAKADTPGMWREFMKHVAAADLQAAQHWDDLTGLDMQEIVDHFNRWTRAGAVLGWGAAKVVTGDYLLRDDGSCEIRVERNGAVHLTEVVASENAAMKRLAELEQQMHAAGWATLDTRPKR